MTGRSRPWWIVVSAFNAVNLLGGIYAAVSGEPMHAALHAVLLVAGVGYAWMSVIARGHDDGAAERSPPVAPRDDVLGDRLANLEQHVDDFALEVERIGEGQRFVTKLFTERDAVKQDVVTRD